MKTAVGIVGVVLLLGSGVAGQSQEPHLTLECRPGIGACPGVIDGALGQTKIVIVDGTAKPGTWIPGTVSCAQADVLRAMNGVAPYLSVQSRFEDATFWPDPEYDRSLLQMTGPTAAERKRHEARRLQSEADALDARDKKISDFQAVLACLNAKEQK
jgi:hypothetical protein